MRALLVAVGMGPVAAACLGDVHIEFNRQLFRRVTRIVVASLVSEFTMNGMHACGSVCRSADQGLDYKIAGIDAQFLTGIKGEAGQLPGRILHSANHQVSRQREAHLRGNQFRSCGLIGVDVETRLDMECEFDWRWMSGLHRDRTQRLKADIGAGRGSQGVLLRP